MTVLKMLTEVICPKEFFGLVAFAELVNVGQMLDPNIPIAREI